MLRMVSIFWALLNPFGFAQDGTVDGSRDRHLSNSILVSGGMTANMQGENLLFSVLYSRPLNDRFSVGLGASYQQAYDLDIIPVFVDLRIFSKSNKFLGGTPGFFAKAGYAAVFGDIIDFDNAAKLYPDNLSLSSGFPSTIDGAGYFFGFGFSLTRQLNKTFSTVLEIGPQLQSIPAGPRMINPSAFGQNPGPGVIGGEPLFFQDGRSTLTSLSVTLGLRF